jgi:hypothetical protein
MDQTPPSNAGDTEGSKLAHACYPNGSTSWIAEKRESTLHRVSGGQAERDDEVKSITALSANRMGYFTATRISTT